MASGVCSAAEAAAACTGEQGTVQASIAAEQPAQAAAAAGAAAVTAAADHQDHGHEQQQPRCFVIKVPLHGSFAGRLLAGEKLKEARA
eukprot:2666520-Pleurochrysis_carterae.AAC.1